MAEAEPQPLALQWAARTEVGLVRGSNQDSVFAGDRLLAVADGMGGMAAGDVASRLVIEAMSPLDGEFAANDLLTALRTAVSDANRRIRDEVEADPAKQGMGTTLTAILFSGTRIGLVHIGDSRAYLLRGEEFSQVTRDDTYVQLLVDEGQITPDEAATHPQRSLVSRVLQGQPTDPVYSVTPARAGDRYLLCSDGLSGVLRAETIEEAMREYGDVDECVDRLVDLALRAGGPDNITVVVADVVGDDVPEPRGLRHRLRSWLSKDEVTGARLPA
ncbi:serine/threonine-protein phosphatase [Dactylosporangium roseum]|uniref:Serine/threonine-protein phosphatase n=1 Tax=Dactylosporangium roseum TaxID=47989 RepID=A0ABY5ZAX7_9ACTN|nr:serine/threonine-protein phosphatase [Dactylosporangium roseum]